MTERTEPAAVAAPDPVGDDAVRDLLQSIVEVARAIFGAQAGSVFLLDEAQGELICQAVSGRSETLLVGRRIPADRGTEPTGERAGDALLAVPLIHGDRVLGVLEVLDPAPQGRSGLTELDLLSLIARQAAAALRIVIDRGADRLAAGPPARDTQRTEVARLVSELEHLLREIPDR